MDRTLVLLPLLILSLVGYCNGFATTEYLATVAYPLKGTRFHDTMTKTAICKIQYDWLVRHTKLKTLKKPKTLLYESCGYMQWGVTLGKTFLVARIAMEELAKASFAPDVDPETKNDPIHHFDSDLLLNKANDRLITVRNNILKVFEDPNADYVDLRKTVGYSLHTLQDFYSHTNWIEMKKKKPNWNIARKADLGVPIAPLDMATCSDCKQDLTPEQKKDADDWANSITNQVFEALSMDFNASNVFICKDNILANGHLTSGYFSTEAKVAPKISAYKKCSHGGGFDASVQITARGGINKDTNTFLYSPHYYLHNAASDMAVRATIDYLEGLRRAIKDEQKFGRFIGMIS
uniref:VWA7 N-terminal domain-containing protein n=1 Tax=Plectus sambesii TaxID=2011161 RepID=A0A914ULA0_9BILA